MSYKVRPYETLYADKVDISIRLVAIMRGKIEDRDMELIGERTRTVTASEVHELILTDEAGEPGAVVRRVAYLGFGEFGNGGVLAAGDRLFAGDRLIGELAGFDYNHMPNHMNIVFRGNVFATGEDQGLRTGDLLTLTRNRPHAPPDR